MNREGIADLTLLRTLLAISQKFLEPSFSEAIDSFVLYASLAASSTLLQILVACLNFTLDSEDLFCWYKQKKWFLWAMAAAQTDENYGYERGLTWFLTIGIYISSNQNPLTKLTSSNRSTKLKDILQWNISQMIMKTIPINITIIIIYAMKCSVNHLMCAIACTYTSTRTTNIMHVKNNKHHFCLWHLLGGTLEWRKWKNKNNKLNSSSLRWLVWLIQN